MKYLLLVWIAALTFACTTEETADNAEPQNNSVEDQDVSNVEPAPTTEELNIVETAVATDDLSTLVAAVTAADLVGTLSGAGPFTVFAPTNAAFEALPAGTLDNLLLPENKDQLVNILTYHVVPGAVVSSALTDGMEVTTVQGGTLTIALGDQVLINDATVVQADVEASNGVVHIIDKVLLP